LEVREGGVVPADICIEEVDVDEREEATVIEEVGVDAALTVVIEEGRVEGALTVVIEEVGMVEEEEEAGPDKVCPEEKELTLCVVTARGDVPLEVSGVVEGVVEGAAVGSMGVAAEVVEGERAEEDEVVEPEMLEEGMGSASLALTCSMCLRKPSSSSPSSSSSTSSSICCGSTSCCFSSCGGCSCSCSCSCSCFCFCSCSGCCCCSGCWSGAVAEEELMDCAAAAKEKEVAAEMEAEVEAGEEVAGTVAVEAAGAEPVSTRIRWM
jgi:hypothetical protein